MTKTLISWGMALTVLCSGLATSCSSSNDEDEGGGKSARAYGRNRSR